jgi:Uma2 family endonuclease
VSRPAGESHQRTAGDLYAALRSAATGGWRVLYEIGLAIGDDRFVPDLVVLPPTAPAAEADFNDVSVVQPALVIEVASRSTDTTDQGDKLVAYARGGIPAYWRVARDGTIYVYRLLEIGAYTVVATVRPGESHDVEWPYAMTLVASERKKS